ncbi:MAG: 30S ribosomal protein S4e [archaeon]|nr:30S ribosomal protein S4e [archaeon]
MTGKRHTKRYNTTKYTHINKKEGKFFMNALPGPHPKRFCLPLAHILRDILQVIDNNREASKIIKEGKVLVDGKVQKKTKFPVGLMDVVEIPDLGKSYRILPKLKQGLVPIEISAKEKNFKLCKINNKTTVKDGHIQLNLHDGRNIVINIKDPKKPSEDKYKTMGVLKIEIPSQEIKDYYELKVNAPILVISGKNLGRSGVVTKIEKRFGPNASIINIKVSDEEIHETAYNYSFVIGKAKSVIKLFSE